MLNPPPAPDPRLIGLVVAALIAVLTMAAVAQSEAAASEAPLVSVRRDERFQPQQERALPPFGARTVLAPAQPPDHSYNAATSR